MAACAVLAGLAGCGDGHFLSNEIDLYHDLQGGAIAEQRPPAPGIDDPYPNLGAVPPRPAAPDVPAQQRIADRLATQRDAAEAAAARDPLTVVPPPPRPAPPKPATAATPPEPSANRLVFDAAAAPATPAPAAPGAATPAPAAPATAAPAPAVAEPTPTAPPPVPGLAAVPAVPAAVVSGPLPSLAAAPPAVPGNVGIGIPAPPPAAPAPAAAAPPAPAANTVVVVFTPGSATLPPSATLNLRRFALAHKGVGLSVTGHGGDVLPGADAQARALDLAIRRAQAIADSLGTAGVPAANLHLRAEAAGMGGAASL